MRTENKEAGVYSVSMKLTETELKVFDAGILQQLRELAILTEKNPKNIGTNYLPTIITRILALAAHDNVQPSPSSPFANEVFVLKKNSKDLIRLTHTEEGLFLEILEPIHFKRT